MYLIPKYAVLVATLLFSTIFAQDLIDSSPKKCPCYTATTYVTDIGCPAFEPTKPCIVPLCILLSTSMIPGPNTKCRKTPTITSYLPCQTACQQGCAIHTTTSTYSSSCLPAKPLSTPTFSKSTITPSPIPRSSKSCYTKTVSATNKCPDDMGCLTPDCIILSRTTVPGGPVEGCPTTETVAARRTCKGSCDGGCATQWVTETASVWKA